MKIGNSSIVTIVVAFVAALLGVLAGRLVLVEPSAPETSFHAVLHSGLNLDAGQRARIDLIEKKFADEQAAYKREMADDNRRLATAIEAERGYGPKVAEAIDRSHHAMGMLQKRTLQHLFAMREVLTPEQAQHFDKAMVEALTAPTQ
ncbi:Spy/CpxP family protein refolding chaperone [Sphingobium xanthum]|uniref:periplasmic heavy metal sensor n=1 Tax=Sphingobium xanthum TaxID=1387165 RepID=UPI001C8CE2E4|nr:periplasmic heavy metal sensor [Sphingobium xanthum]